MNSDACYYDYDYDFGDGKWQVMSWNHEAGSGIINSFHENRHYTPIKILVYVCHK